MSSYDVTIIGAGAVGCSLSRQFASAGARVLVLEKGADILSGASKANSAILHTGFDAPAGSLELACIREGYREYLEIREDMNLPVLETGAMVVAWSETQLARLPVLEAKARANGIDDCYIIDGSEVRLREPNLSRRALGALVVPGEHLIDPWSPFLAYATQARLLGADLVFDSEVTGGDFDGNEWTVSTTSARYMTKSIVNCAGVFGDEIERRLLGESHFEIRPRKGQFVVFDKAAAQLLGSIVLPVPDERTKGIVLTRTVFGNVLVGPTAEEQTDRVRASVEHDALEMLVTRATEMLPALSNVPVTATYAGLRPASDKSEYRIHQDKSRNWITVGGIRSTGMTSALGLARHVLGLHGGRQVRDLPAVVLPNLAEHAVRDWQNPGYGEIVCHCEMVTLREIEATFDTPLPPGDFGGLKRRTRCGMGRCQGFNCTARLAELTKGRMPFPIPVTDIA